MNEVLTVEETASFLRKHPDTIRNWIEKKKLPARKLSAGKNGIYAILRNDLLELAVTKTLERKDREPKTRKNASTNSSLQIHLPI